MRRALLALFAVIALFAAGFALPAATAQADSTHDVGLTGFADLVVDQAHGHVFISQHTGTVVVTNLAGSQVGTLDNLSGANGMTLSDDGSELYVALTDGDAIAQVDTAHPFAENAVTTFPTGADTCPLDVAYSAGLVWYDATCNGGFASITPLDPTTGTFYDPIDNVAYDARLAASPSLPDTIFAGDQGLSPASIYKLTVTGIGTGGDTPTLTDETQWDVNPATSMAVSSDGSQVLTGGRQAFSTSDLTKLHTYQVPHSTSAVAMRASDDLVAFGSDDGVVLYHLGAATSFGTYRFDDDAASVVQNGLAFGTSSLYAVTYDAQSKSPYALQVITPHNRPRAKVSVAVSGKHHRYGKKATVTVTLHGHKSKARLEIWAVTRDGKEYFLKRGKPDSHGRLSMRLDMTVNATFVGIFDGDSKVALNGAGKYVKVEAWAIGKLFHAKRHAGHYALYKPGQKAIYAAAIGPNKKGQCMYFTVQFHARGHWGYGGTTQCIALGKQSSAGVYLQGSQQLAGIPIRFRASWRGDLLNTRTTTKWSYAKFTGSARGATRLAPGKLASRYAVLSGSLTAPLDAPKIRSPFSQQTARNQSSPSSSLVNPRTWVS